MAKKRDNFRLGLTVIVMMFLFVAAALFIGGGDLFAPATSPLVVRFMPGTAVPELSQGSVVIYFGQKVGEVDSSRFVTGSDPNHPEISDLQFLEVHARVRSDLDLREDCRIIATGPPLGGKGYMEIHDRGISAIPLPQDAYVYASVTGFQTIIDNLSEQLDETNPASLLASIKMQLNAEDQASLVAKIHIVAENVQAATASLAKELDQEQDDVVMTKVHEALDRINVALAEAVALLQDSRPKVDQTLTSIQSAADTLDVDVMAALAEQLELQGGTQPGTLMTKVHDALDCLKSALYDVNVVTAEGKSVVVLNKDRINELIQNATDASSILKLGLKDLGLNPWKVMWPPSTAEKRELHMYNVAREFADAAAHVDDASSRLKSLVDSRLDYIRADDPDLIEIRADLEASLERFTTAEQALLRELKVE